MSQDILTAMPKVYFLTQDGGLSWTPATAAEYVAASGAAGIPTCEPPGVSAFGSGLLGGHHALWPAPWRAYPNYLRYLRGRSYTARRNNPRITSLHKSYRQRQLARRRRNR